MSTIPYYIEYIDNNIKKLVKKLKKLHTVKPEKETVGHFPSTEEHLPIPQFDTLTKRKNISEEEHLQIPQFDTLTKRENFSKCLTMFKEIEEIVKNI